MTIGDIRQDGAVKLRQGGIETPILDAAVLLAHILGMDKSQLILQSAKVISEQNAHLFYASISRRMHGECIAYLIGKKEFRGQDFKVTDAVLVPRPETETLVESAIAWIDAKTQGPIAVLDLCTGSGCVAISIKSERPNCEVAASDISEDALAVALENTIRIFDSRKNTDSALQNTPTISLYKSDLFSNLTGRFSVIVSNPPYIPSSDIPLLKKEVRNEPIIALDGGLDGLDLIRRIIEEARWFLEPGGRLFLESDPKQTKKIQALFLKWGYGEISVFKDLSGNARVTGASYLQPLKKND
jgi:release factor glutamine methyltransferase